MSHGIQISRSSETQCTSTRFVSRHASGTVSVPTRTDLIFFPLSLFILASTRCSFIFLLALPRCVVSLSDLIRFTAIAGMDYKSRATSGEQAYPMQDGAKSHVSAKYLGTEGDKAQMRRLGRTQETRRVFTFITILGFGSTLICTWEVLLTNIGLILVNGGTAGMFWGFLFVLLGWTVVYLSLSEMASM
jgi:hypothetical protein